MAGRIYYPRCRVVLDVVLEDFAGGADDSIHIIEAYPLEVEIQRNDHRQADTAAIELDYRNMPIDPRTLRAVRVIVLMGTVDEPTEQLSADNEAHRAFLGFVDEPRIKLSDDGDRVMLEARDATALFLDYDWPAATAIDINRYLEAVVWDVLDMVPGASGLQEHIRWSDNGIRTYNLADLIGRTRWTPQPGDDAWTVLVELCGLAGLIPTINLDTLEILSAVDVRTRSARFVYGENIASLEYGRRMYEARTAQIVIRAWDEQNRTLTEATYPATQAAQRTKIGINGKATRQSSPAVPYYVTGSYSQSDLEALAESLYEQAAKRQIEGEIETKDLRDLQSTTDLWLMSNGDEVQVSLGRGEAEALEGLAHSEAVAWLVQRGGWSESVAETYVAAFDNAESLATTFYVRRASHRWSHTDGYSCRLEFVNYV
jgi:hypothetical protein